MPGTAKTSSLAGMSTGSTASQSEKSTVPVRTGERIAQALQFEAKAAGLKADLARDLLFVEAPARGAWAIGAGRA